MLSSALDVVWGVARRRGAIGDCGEVALHMPHYAVSLHSPETYEICVSGKLDLAWGDYIDAGAVSYVDDEEGGLQTVIILRDVDQSALIGLINALFGWGVPLLSVRHVRRP